MFRQKAVFFLLIIFCLSPLASPPAALALGLALALTIKNPYSKASKKLTKHLQQASVVLLGFGMNLTSVVRAGTDGLAFTVATIFGTLLLGYLLGKYLGINDKISSLISSGTAICGGSAIAAVAPAIEADGDEISVSLATVFILNAVALFAFPAVGHLFGLSEKQFGIWAAVAIHDTSSVVGAGARYGAEALQTATTVKLSRALWIAPVAFLFAYIYRAGRTGKKAKAAIPWFILFFLLATVARTYAPLRVPTSLFDSLVNLAKAGLTVTLFLIGAGLSREVLKKVGARPLQQGFLLWLAISIVSLAAVAWFL